MATGPERRFDPKLSQGDLVKVAGGRNQAEAELIQGLLAAEGVPSLVRRSAGFDVPDMLAAGPRDVMVPRSGVATAREVLLQAALLAPAGAVDSPRRILLGILVAVAIVALIVVVGAALLG